MSESKAALVKANLKYESSPIQVKKREARNKARYNMIKMGKVHKHDHVDVMHIDGHALHNTPSNWKAGSRHKNRSYRRTAKAHKLDPNS